MARLVWATLPFQLLDLHAGDLPIQGLARVLSPDTNPLPLLGSTLLADQIVGDHHVHFPGLVRDLEDAGGLDPYDQSLDHEVTPELRVTAAKRPSSRPSTGGSRGGAS
jgi:hypothetical protein